MDSLNVAWFPTWSTDCADGRSCLLHSNSRGSPFSLGSPRHFSSVDLISLNSLSEELLSTTNICACEVYISRGREERRERERAREINSFIHVRMHNETNDDCIHHFWEDHKQGRVITQTHRLLVPSLCSPVCVCVYIVVGCCLATKVFIGKLPTAEWVWGIIG